MCAATTPSSEFAPSRALTRTAHESQTLDLFWEAYLPNGRPVPERLLRNFTCCWTEVARKLYTEDDCLRYALWANCLGNLHVRGGGPWLEAESIKLYGKALAALSGALQVPEKAKSDALLVAVKLLGLFEVLDPHSPWKHHCSQYPANSGLRSSSVMTERQTTHLLRTGTDTVQANLLYSLQGSPMPTSEVTRISCSPI